MRHVFSNISKVEGVPMHPSFVKNFKSKILNPKCAQIKNPAEFEMFTPKVLPSFFRNKKHKTTKHSNNEKECREI